MSPENVLTYWFGESVPVDPDRISFWFQKSDETDAEIRERFESTVQQGLAGRLDSWAETPRGLLALVIVLDQFTRNIYRNTPRAFGGDPVAHALTLTAIEKGWDNELHADEAFFLYMPLEHQEDLHLQDLCVECMKGLADRAGEEDKKFKEFVKYAEKHREVIAEYGRFPHRNEIFGRPSTDAELEYLAQPGAGF